MSQTIEGKEYTAADLEEIRIRQLDILAKDKGNSDAICELVCADALLCKENVMDFGPSWLNPPLCREIAKYMPAIIDGGGREQLAINVCQIAAEHLFHHPRLKLELLELQREAVIALAGEDAEDAEMGIDDLSVEINRYRHNIMAADLGNLDDIEPSGLLRSDHVEWTAEFENAIDAAESKAAEQLKDTPRGMGFCFAWWHVLVDILKTDYSIIWHSPSQMNPHVVFD